MMMASSARRNVTGKACVISLHTVRPEKLSPKLPCRTLTKYFPYCTNSGSLRLNLARHLRDVRLGTRPVAALADERVSRQGPHHRVDDERGPDDDRDHLKESPDGVTTHSDPLLSSMTIEHYSPPRSHARTTPEFACRCPGCPATRRPAVARCPAVLAMTCIRGLSLAMSWPGRSTRRVMGYHERLRPHHHEGRWGRSTVVAD